MAKANAPENKNSKLMCVVFKIHWNDPVNHFFLDEAIHTDTPDDNVAILADGLKHTAYSFEENIMLPHGLVYTEITLYHKMDPKNFRGPLKDKFET